MHSNSRMHFHMFYNKVFEGRRGIVSFAEVLFSFTKGISQCAPGDLLKRATPSSVIFLHVLTKEKEVLSLSSIASSFLHNLTVWEMILNHDHSSATEICGRISSYCFLQ